MENKSLYILHVNIHGTIFPGQHAYVYMYSNNPQYNGSVDGWFNVQCSMLNCLLKLFPVRWSGMTYPL